MSDPEPSVPFEPPTPRPLPGFRLVNEDGNAFSIMARFSKAARKAGLDAEERGSVITLATKGDYAHLLATFSKWSVD